MNRGPIPAPYPNQIGMQSMAELQAGAQAPPSWNFNGAVVNAAVGTPAPSRWLVLLAEQSVALNQVPQGSNWNLVALRAAKSQFDRRLASRGYQLAGPRLGERLGKFCSYCEQAVTGQIAVEHCTPKSQFPYFTICWENLLLACDACNGLTGKADKPTRAEVVGWAPLPPNVDDVILNQRILQHYLWPTNQLSYRNLLPLLTFRNGNQWQPIPVAETVAAGMTI
ncbi:MAG TPA: hypothetical protein VGI73_06640, partial [Solirubrobacterales bacterium]